MRLSVNLNLNSSLQDEAVKSQLEKLDRALLNSALSYAVYTKNESWYEFWFKKRQENPDIHLYTEHFVKKDENFKKDKLYDRAFAALIADKMNPVDLDLKSSANHISERYLYDFDSKYEKGVYKAMDNLSAATAVTSKNSDGTETLHVSFRGTDTLAQPFAKFFLKAYLDMSAYYESFKPFEEAVLKYAADPKNKISKIEVSGHSLGGAMVQHFFHSEEVKKCNKKMQGFTYGSPPAVANEAYAMFPAFRHILAKKNFKNFVRTVEDLAKFKHWKKEPRITQYQHIGDIVPKVGNFIMSKTGQEIVTLKDRASKENHMDYLLTGDKSMKLGSAINNKFLNMMETVSEIFLKKPLRFVIRMKQTVYHDMARYTVNLDAQINEIKKANIERLNQNNVQLSQLCPINHSFNVSCQIMRLQSQSKMRLSGQETDFNSDFDTGLKLEKLMQTMDFSKLSQLRKKMLNPEPGKACAIVSYSRI